MEFERLERAWRSPENMQPETAAIDLKEKMVKTLLMRRAARRVCLALVGFALVLWTGALFHAAFMEHSLDPTLSNLWLLVALFWVLLVLVGAQNHGHLSRHPQPEGSMRDSLAAMIDDNATARRRYRLLGGGLVAFVVLMGLVLAQLEARGLMDARDIWQGGLLFGSTLIVTTAACAWRYFRRLKPEGERLTRLLSEYGE